ncbi:MAG: UDP-glucose/GDP-mannose dehydrogenase family protein [Calditrichaeota bacterium]|nr:UDP-glucose/GDP-mannose dehydrogenase family protein [Calditrichota bacterium]
MKVAVIGTGYVGLVTAACLAENGNDVIGVDIDPGLVERLSAGSVHIYEPGLEPLVRHNLAAGRLSFTTDTVAAVRSSDVVFFALPTPMSEDGAADLSHLLSAAKVAADGIESYKVIVNKSTVPVGTARQVRELIASLSSAPFDVVSNPEFLKEGAAVDDFMKPDRVVIGSDSPRAIEVMTSLYSSFMRISDRIIVMKVESAELTKYAANAFLATKVAFINEISRLCDVVGADVEEVRNGIGSDERIGRHFLFPSLGFGGSCFPKDLRALVHTAERHDSPLLISEATIRSNEFQKQSLVGKIKTRFGGNLSGIKVAQWGLAFKARTDDVRESPAIEVARSLLTTGAIVTAFDPEAMGTARRVLGNAVIYADNAYAALKGADALIIATEWNEFRNPDFARIQSLMRQPIIFDGRNLYDPERMTSLGFEYYGVGRGSHSPGQKA